MATQFDRWEKDPFFSAAEEVQESADRMESTYRIWIHSKKDTSSIWNQDELHRDLRTALGTTKWQLDEFERAVRSSDTSTSVDDAKHRHSEFIIAIQSQIFKVENCLHKLAASGGKPPLPWMRLDDGERNELAMFLLGQLASPDNGHQEVNHLELGSLKKTSQTIEHNPAENRQEKLAGHRRTVSAAADIGVWKITMPDDALLQSSPDEPRERTPRKIPSFSGVLNTMDSASNLKISKNGYRKSKTTDYPPKQANNTVQSQHFSRGISACYERSNSCLDSCDECYDKQLDGWYGALQRQLQRSQYHMQYIRPTKVVFLIFLLPCLIVLFVLRGI